MTPHQSRTAASNQDGGCCAVEASDVDADAIETDVAVLSALANRTRYGALRVLNASAEPVCACEFVGPLDVSQSGVSHALSVLHEAGLVSRRKEGRWRYYSLTPRAERLLAAIDVERESDRDTSPGASEVSDE